MLQRKFTEGLRSIAYIEYSNNLSVPFSETQNHTDQLPSLVILHGLFGMADNWHTFCESLLAQADHIGKGLTIYSLDLPGHGASSWQASYRYEDMAKSIALEFLEQLQEPFILLGHSLGGKTALFLALNQEDYGISNLKGMILVDIAPIEYPDRHSGIFQALISLNVTACYSRTAAQTALAKSIQDPMLRGFLLKNLAIDSEQGGAWIVDVQGLARQYKSLRSWPDTVLTYFDPALWIMGSASEYLQPKDSVLQSIRTLAPNAQIEIIPGAGHWVHADKKDETLAAVFAFLCQTGRETSM